MSSCCLTSLSFYLYHSRWDNVSKSGHNSRFWSNLFSKQSLFFLAQKSSMPLPKDFLGTFYVTEEFCLKVDWSPTFDQFHFLSPIHNNFLLVMVVKRRQRRNYLIWMMMMTMLVKKWPFWLKFMIIFQTEVARQAMTILIKIYDFFSRQRMSGCCPPSLAWRE